MKREVSKEEILSFAKTVYIEYFEVSAKLAENIDLAFNSLIEKLKKTEFSN